jgi:hypothetical protein
MSLRNGFSIIVVLIFLSAFAFSIVNTSFRENLQIQPITDLHDEASQEIVHVSDATPPLPPQHINVARVNETNFLIRNISESCGVERSRDIMQECSATFLPPMPRSSPSYVEKQCKLARELFKNDTVALDHDGFSFWQGMDFGRTRSVKGDITMLKNALMKAKNGQCLKIAVVGGSHCAGTCTPQPKNDSFVKMLEDYLNQRLPVSGCEHETTGTQFCLNGTPSPAHAYQTRSQIVKALPADVVLFEFANNDLQHAEKDATSLFHQGWSLEYIYRKWKEAGVAPMFIESSFRINWIQASNTFYAVNGESYHKEFLETYHVPTVSFSSAVLPEFWKQRFDPESKFHERKIFGDYRGHMVPHGHAIVAAMILQTFESILKEEPEIFAIPSELQFIPEAYYKRLDEDSIYQVDFLAGFRLGSPQDEDRLSAKGKMSMSREWKLTNEGRSNKWGLVSNVPGSIVMVQLPTDAHSLYLTVLKSYENVGIAQITLENCTNSFELQPQELDCLWSSRSSQNYVFSMEFNRGACSLLKITVKDTNRPLNKIKLISLSFT